MPLSLLLTACQDVDLLYWWIYKDYLFLSQLNMAWECIALLTCVFMCVLGFMFVKDPGGVRDVENARLGDPKVPSQKYVGHGQQEVMNGKSEPHEPHKRSLTLPHFQLEDLRLWFRNWPLFSRRMYCDRVSDQPRYLSQSRVSEHDDREARYWTRKLYDFESNDPDRYRMSCSRSLQC